MSNTAQLNEQENGPVHSTKRTRLRGVGAIALVSAAALILSGCAPLDGLFGFGSPLDEQTVTQPEPAAIEDDEFATQEPNWEPCANGMDCAEVFAPLDWNDPSGERITLALVKQSAKKSQPLGTIFVNPGGPGASGVTYISNSIDYAVGEDLQDAYDIIGWDPRGVGASSAVTCLDAREMDDYLFGVSPSDSLEEGSEAWLTAVSAEARAFGDACANSTGDLIGFVDTQSTVMDLDMLRSIVGDEKLNYLGYSYGTYIGARYADTFPDRVGRLVLDGAIDPDVTEADVVREQTIGFEAALRAYVTDCLGRDDCPVSGTVDEAMARWGALIGKVDAQPLTGSDGRNFSSGTMLTAIITPLYSEQNWPYLDMLYESVASGDPGTGFFLADFYYGRSGGAYDDNSTEAFSAINCLDYPSNEMPSLEAMRADAAELAALAPTIGKYQGYGGVFCASWPLPSVDTRGPVTGSGADPILVVGTTGDPATPYKWSVALAEQLESGVLVTYQGEGHTAYGQSDCIDRVVEAYFLDGAVPSADPMCSAGS